MRKKSLHISGFFFFFFFFCLWFLFLGYVGKRVFFSFPFFKFQFFDVAKQLVIHNKKILSKFGYRPTMTVFPKINNPLLYIWRTAGNLLSPKKKKKKKTGEKIKGQFFCPKKRILWYMWKRILFLSGEKKKPKQPNP